MRNSWNQLSGVRIWDVPMKLVVSSIQVVSPFDVDMIDRFIEFYSSAYYNLLYYVPIYIILYYSPSEICQF